MTLIKSLIKKKAELNYRKNLNIIKKKSRKNKKSQAKTIKTEVKHNHDTFKTQSS